MSAGARNRVAFRVRVPMAADPAAVFAALTDWPAQTRWVPLTRVRRLPGPVRAVGEEFSTVSGVGPLRLVDPMRVQVRVAPEGERAGVVDLVKTGSVLGGTASILVAPEGGGTRVTWIEDVEVRPPALAALARIAGPLAGVAGRVAFGLVLRRARIEIERAAVASGPTG